jgi:hypothetical protein
MEGFWVLKRKNGSFMLVYKLQFYFVYLARKYIRVTNIQYYYDGYKACYWTIAVDQPDNPLHPH